MDYPDNQVWRCVLVQMTAESGKAESRQIFETLAANDFAELPFREMWLVSVCFLAEAASVLGDARSASVLYQLMLRTPNALP